MSERYGQLTSYQDTGVMLSHDPKKSSPDQIVFKTAFSRPQAFRFEWVSHHPHEPLRHITTRSVVWSQGGEAFLYRSRPEKTESKPLHLAVAAATGVSRGSAHRIVRMLLPQVGGFTFTDLQGSELAGEEEFEGVACVRVKAQHPGGDSYELWIGKADVLLRRLVRRASGFPDAEEIRRDIITNAPIPDTVFQRDPP